MGFSVISGDPFGVVLHTDNASFDGTQRGGVIGTNGQLWIGSNASPRVKVGTLTSPDASITIGYSSPNITLTTAGSVATTYQANSGSATPLANILNIFGSIVAAGTNPLRTIGAGNTVTVQTQYSQALAAADGTKVGLANFDSASFAVGVTGFVTASGTGLGKTITGNSGGALSPTAGNWNILGASTAAGTSPVTTSGAVSTLTVNVQKSQAIAATDATKIGLSNFDSAKFTVDANGFVSTSGTGIANTITGDSGGALSPTAGNWNILGLSGSKTSGSGSTLTIKSPPYADAGGSATSTLNSGSFVTGAFTLTLPVSAGLADGDTFQYVATSAAIYVIQAVGAQKIRIGNVISSAAGAATSDGLAGTALVLRFRASDGFFYAMSTIGVFVLS